MLKAVEGRKPRRIERATALLVELSLGFVIELHCLGLGYGEFDA